MAQALPLRSRTPDHWGTAVLEKPLELLSDHAYLEKKAAANAMELLNRWPGENPCSRWVLAMADIARDETAHLAQVCRLLKRMGGSLARNHRNPYASELRKLVRFGSGPGELLDRLLVSGLIEARSCERFEVLGRAARTPALAKLYNGLYASEAGHFRTFLNLAEFIVDQLEVNRRWQWMLDAENEILSRQPFGFRMHSGLPEFQT